MSILKDSQSYNLQSLSLLDEEFLATLSEQRDREIFAKVIALDFDENPVDQIEGRVTGGSINIDGESSVRRTCNLTMISENVDINDFYWGIKTKFKLEIGLKNNLTGTYAAKNNLYPEIVWFSQGYYVVSSFSTSISTGSCSISLQGKDKMSLLNGDLGGQLYSSVNFGTEEFLSKTVSVVNLNTLTSSENITLNKYFIKAGSQTLEFQPNEKEKNILAIQQNPFYVFITNPSGKYYKKENSYIYDSRVNIKYPQYKYYDMYKKVSHPDELFVKVINFTNDLKYLKNTFYYKKDNNDSYYIIDTEETPKNGRQYYQLRTLYTINEESTITQLNIENILKNAIHTYANEPYHNIIINDLDDYGLEQLTYKGEEPLYALYHVQNSQFTQLILSGTNSDFDSIVNDINFKFYSSFANDAGSKIGLRGKKFVGRLENGSYIPYKESNGEWFQGGSQQNSDILYQVMKIEYGMDIGYRLTDLTYTGDLITGIGESLTYMLDKIKQMLGDFEYFYDINGKFIFQKKKTYVNTAWSQLTDNEDEDYVDYANDKHKFSFNFEGNRLISSIQNSPVLNNLKNDFVVWGKRKGISGADIPIHARYAIDKKPVYYKALNGKIYTTNIYYAFEQENLPKEEYENSGNTIPPAINDFQLNEYYPIGLTKPRKNNDGTWSKGWWHISDWARYYKLLKNTSEDPVGTMKFYSSNDEDGCVPVSTIWQLPGLGEGYKNNNRSVWLIEIITRSNGSQYTNLAHGYGEYGSRERECTYYEGSQRTDLKKTFKVPYSQCSDDHTYLYFRNLKNSDVYFYNPNFPTGETASELIQEQLITNKEQWLIEHNVYVVDWREIIYQMALDFFAGQGCSNEQPLYIKNGNNWEPMTDPDHFLYEVGRRNEYYYPTGYTGYEQYYTDLQGNWRKIYNPDYLPNPQYSTGYYENKLNENQQGYYSRTKIWTSPRIEDYDIDFYVNKNRSEIAKQLEELIELKDNMELDQEYRNLIYSVYEKYLSFSKTTEDEDAFKYLYWNRAVFEQPETLDFWFEFLDSDLELAQFSVPQVGDRTKVVNEDKAGAIVFSDVPNFILYEAKAKDEMGNNIEKCDESKLRREIVKKSGQTFIYLPKGFAKLFTISWRNMSVKNKIDALLYQYSYCIENISLNTIPVYYLEPNTRIFVQDKDTGINGEYIVSRISIPLTYNGTMSISAIKAPERLY